MQRVGGQIVFSPSDLTEFMESRFASWMSRRALDRPDTLPPEGEGDDAPRRLQLQRHGEAHERRVIERLVEEGRDLVEIATGTRAERAAAHAETLDAMRKGRQVICQAKLERAPFAGYADFLVRIDDWSTSLGSFGYEVWEAKLAQQTRPYFLIQLCSYAEMLAEIQGKLPACVQVALGSDARRSYRTENYSYYFRELQRRFLEFMDRFDPDDPPVPDPHADHRRWQERAEARLEELDHVSRVARVSTSQVTRLAENEIRTMAGLSQTGLERIARIQDATFGRMKEQAGLQIESRGLERPAFRALEPVEEDPHKGLALLPPASPLDVWFDMEGYPFSGLEYLFGASHEEHGKLAYADWWAHDKIEEKLAFEGFVDWAVARWRRDPEMHIYHYASYEVTAMKRLMGEYGTREHEIDELLRNHVFVDLYAVVRNGVLVGEPSYSLKNVERLYLERREGEVTSGGDSILQYEEWMDSGEPGNWAESQLLSEIRDYNRVDCESTKFLADWLRARQDELQIPYNPEPEREDRPENEAIEARQALAERMLERLPEDPEDAQIQQMLAQLLEFHRREAKPAWWAYFDRMAMTVEQRIDDMECLGGLARTDRPEFPKGQSTALEYRFNPDQDTKVREGRYYEIPQSPEGAVRLAELDRRNGLAVISFALRGAPGNRICLTPNEVYSAGAIEESIEEAANAWMQDRAIRPALADFLLRRDPVIGGERGGKLVADGEDPQRAVVRLVSDLGESTLCIQGPPGSGKTWAAADAILELLAAGRTVGITSNSHAAILNLMRKCVEKSPELACLKIGGGNEDELFESPGVEYVASAARAPEMIGASRLVGGTAWAFSNEALRDRVDYLFVDEAGQVSVANLVGMARSTRRLVLLGDQMQLGQPIQGSHPGDSGRSTLDYLLGDEPTIPDHLGVFLDRTWRLHPDVCSFISGAVYEDRLHARPGTEKRVVRVPESAKYVTREAGLLFVPVEHEGNRQGSDEEVARIVEIVGELLGRAVTDIEGRNAGTLQLADILFVAPYNMQVRSLETALPPDARVGSVDRFQGQQARVVLVSMCSSEPSSSPRGIDFLFNRNRLNVAISRAQSLAIVVGSPALTGGACGSVEQMELSNLFCRIVEAGSA